MGWVAGMPLGQTDPWACVPERRQAARKRNQMSFANRLHPGWLMGIAGIALSIPLAASAAELAEAKTTFASRCAMCHGAAGKGDGAASAGLNPKPRNLADATWQKSVTDDYLEKVISGGGVAVGKSPLMPAAADLKKEQVSALRALIRSFAK